MHVGGEAGASHVEVSPGHKGNAGPRTRDGLEGGNEVLKGVGEGSRFLNVFFLDLRSICPVGMWPGWGRVGKSGRVGVYVTSNGALSVTSLEI